MIKLACNYSLPLVKFIQTEQMKVDYIKLSRADVIEQELAVAKSFCPCLLHYLPSLGLPREFWREFNYQKLNDFAARAQTPYLSIHLDAYADKLGALKRNELLGLLVENYQTLEKNLTLPLLIENCDRFPYGEGFANETRFGAISEPAFISEFLTQTNSALLLDLAHAQCAADFYEQEPEAYLSQLPLAKVREIHLSGSRKIDGHLSDTHFALQERDYQLLSWTLERVTPEIVTLEYGGTGEAYIQPEQEKNNPEDLLKQWQRLVAICDHKL
jgi:uncharacterized protein (UPF0276 family)